MGRLIIDHPARPRRSARVERFVALERSRGRPLSPLFENLYRRARKGQSGQGRLPHYLAIARRG